MKTNSLIGSKAKYRCSSCFKIHESFKDAETCHPSQQPVYVFPFICKACQIPFVEERRIEELLEDQTIDGIKCEKGDSFLFIDNKCPKCKTPESNGVYKCESGSWVRANT